MADSLDSLHAAVQHWAHTATDKGWLPVDALAVLDDAVLATPGALFDDAERPLVAALFGGTGVGKSTLMNRLAREPVARASAERPTSRDITVYAHRSTPIDGLAKSLPMERVRTTLHGNDHWRDVLWLDMPDVDSVEESNRELVLSWLPHVDALLYVVSPERYRDDEGWRLLLQHGAHHAWLFVVNHWDRGDERQIEDFRAMLVAAGLDAPMIFRSDSGPDAGPDDFAELEATLAELGDRQLVTQLESRGVMQRVATLRARSDALQTQLGDAAALQKVPEQWRENWAAETTTLDEALGWRIAPLAEALTVRTDGSGFTPLSWLGLGTGSRAAATLALPSGPASDLAVDAAATAASRVSAAASSAATLARPTGEPRTSTTAPASNTSHRSGEASTLLDADALARIDGAIERFAQQTADAGLAPLAVMRRHLSPARATLGERLPRLVDDAVARSLAQPGNRWQRLAHRIAGLLAGILPIAAMGWIAWRVLDAFRDGATNPAAYLSSNFAINSGLLLALAWLLPLFARRKLRPSRERAVARGLQQGLTRALSEAGTVVSEGLEGLAGERLMLETTHADLWSRANLSNRGTALPERVRRLLFDQAPRDAQRTAGVLATAHNSTDAAPVS